MIKWHRHSNGRLVPSARLSASTVARASSMSKGEIDISLNPHNLLIKIVISFRVQGEVETRSSERIFKLARGRGRVEKRKERERTRGRHNNVIYIHFSLGTIRPCAEANALLPNITGRNEICE